MLGRPRAKSTVTVHRWPSFRIASIRALADKTFLE